MSESIHAYTLQVPRPLPTEYEMLPSIAWRFSHTVHPGYGVIVFRGTHAEDDKQLFVNDIETVDAIIDALRCIRAELEKPMPTSSLEAEEISL